MKVDDFIKKVSEKRFISLFDVTDYFKDYVTLTKKFQDIDDYEDYSYATNYYKLEDGIVSVKGLYKKRNSEVSFRDLIDYDANYCEAEIELQKLPCCFKIGDLVEFKDKNPGSTGLSHNSIYEYLGDCEMKDNMYGWIPAVMYKNNNKIYIRRQDDFVRKFIRIGSN